MAKSASEITNEFKIEGTNSIGPFYDFDRDTILHIKECRSESEVAALLTTIARGFDFSRMFSSACAAKNPAPAKTIVI